MSDLDGAGASGEHALDAQLELLDRQIVDPDGRMVAKVDDVELEERQDGRIVVSALLTGPGALGPRLGGALGSITTAAWSRLSGRDQDDPKRIDIGAVSEIGTAITLAVSRRTADVDGFELWMRGRVIAALPGEGTDPEE
jgi:sporulation protein YlmC with PRC-barrel domain